MALSPTPIELRWTQCQAAHNALRVVKAFLFAILVLFASGPAIASWDVIAQDLPKVAKVSQIPDDFKPKPLGKRKALAARISKVIHGARFDRDGWASVEGPDTNLEINLGREEDVDFIGFHGRGGAGDVEVVDRVLKALDLRAIDVQTGNFFSKNAALDSHRRWRAQAATIGR